MKVAGRSGDESVRGSHAPDDKTDETGLELPVAVADTTSPQLENFTTEVPDCAP